MIKPTKKQIAFMNFTNEEIKYELNVECRELNKDLSNLMECLRKQEKDNKAILFVGRNFKKVILPYEEYQKMYQRLEAIDKKRCGANVEKIIIDEFVPSNELDNAKPSEALEDSLKLYKMVESAGNGNGFNLNEAWEYHKTIKQALLKAQEQEKVLKVIFEKGVEIALFNDSKTVEDYNRNRNWGAKELTQEEFDLLKKWIEK